MIPKKQVKEENVVIHQKITIKSTNLNRKVQISLFLPRNYRHFETLPTLFLNDGQDFENLRLIDSLTKNNEKYSESPLLIIGIWANEKRLFEYGTSGIADYKNRGNLASEFKNFIIFELFPFLSDEFKIKFQQESTFYAGFSLGGLSAFDIAWENPKYFSKIGVFSGSFWWRKKEFNENYFDNSDRILHEKIRKSVHFSKNQKFWLECGTEDEENDRNNNGIIDSIDDTLDLIKELNIKGFQTNKDITYLEVENGKHNFETWSKVFPIFLEWLYT